MKMIFRPGDLVLCFLSYLVIFSFVVVPHASAVDLKVQSARNQFLGTLGDAVDDFMDALPADGNYLFQSAISDVADVFKLPFQENEIGSKQLLAGSLMVGAIPATIYGLDEPHKAEHQKHAQGRSGSFTRCWFRLYQNWTIGDHPFRRRGAADKVG